MILISKKLAFYHILLHICNIRHVTLLSIFFYIFYIVTMRFENASFRRFFLIIICPNDQSRRTHCLKNYHSFEHARAEDDRRQPIVADRFLTRRNPAPTSIVPESEFRAAWKRRSTRQGRLSPEIVKNYKLNINIKYSK